MVRQIPNGIPYEVNSAGSMTIARDGKKAVLRIMLGITNDHAVISDANNAAQIWRSNC